MDLKSLTHEELIDYCIKNKINYTTKLKKPMAKRTLLTLLTKLPDITKKNEPYKIKQQELTKLNELNTLKETEVIYDDNLEINYIKFGDLFELIKSNLTGSVINYEDKGVTFITNDNKNKKIKSLNPNDFKITSGFNIFIGITSNANKIPIKCYDGNCYYSNTMILCKLKEQFTNKINLKYIYNYLLHKKKYIESTYQCGLTNKTLDTYLFNFMLIPIPSLNKQTEIVKDIEDIDAIINSKKILIKNLNYEEIIYYKYLNNYLNKNYEIQLLSDLCISLPKSLLEKTYGEKEGLYPFYNNPIKIDSYVYNNDYNTESLIIVDDIENKPNIYYSIEFSVANNCHILQNKDNSIINLKYIYYYLTINKECLIHYKNSKIPIPPIKKQNELIIEIEKYNQNKNNTLKILELNLKDNINIKNYLFL